MSQDLIRKKGACLRKFCRFMRNPMCVWGNVVAQPMFSAFGSTEDFADVIAYQEAGGIKDIDVVEAFDLVERNRM